MCIAAAWTGVGLETLNEQISAFTRLTQAQQREMLAQDLVQTPAENVADVKELHRLWRIGDADALKAWDDAKTEKLARSKQLATQINNRVVVDRNYRFAARVVAMAGPNKPVFVAIGALHLGVTGACWRCSESVGSWWIRLEVQAFWGKHMHDHKSSSPWDFRPRGRYGILVELSIDAHINIYPKKNRSRESENI